MKFLKGLLFVFGVMLLGATFKMDQGGDMPFIAFLFYGFFAISVLIGWAEVEAFVW
ncbi:hypothetical protein [Kosakonia oryzae]|uniref:Uncharacterized protein n=1 Tax=Kosakonia oryzae TaxID=497725 RepID=A0AA94H1U0_9ENTR|nr:hypothetical protein [Kosakonia oryzae]QSV12318.1 hypothetical protein AWR26_25025 [Kosakonia oryzae]SFC02479.1 hypothetical protein SAMN05216286_1336 [Kosakonia oryzae]